MLLTKIANPPIYPSGARYRNGFTGFVAIGGNSAFKNDTSFDQILTLLSMVLAQS